MFVLLIFHLLSHALLGAAVSFCLLPRSRFKYRLSSILIGGISGIAPDFIGAREVDTWTHSIFFAPILVLWIAILGKWLFRGTVTFKVVWGVSTLSLIIGHLLLDYMGHDVTLFSPFIKKPLANIVIILGDPWIWFPLTIGLLVGFFLKYRPRTPVVIALVCIVTYLGFKMTAIEIILHQIKSQIVTSEPSFINIEPDQYGFSLNPIDWLQFRYSIFSEHHLMGGYAGIFGEELKVVWHSFYPISREILKTRGHYTVVNPSIPYTVIEEWENNHVKYLVGTDQGKNYLFSRIVGAEWIEVIGEEKLKILKNKSLP